MGELPAVEDTTLLTLLLLLLLGELVTAELRQGFRGTYGG